MCAWPIPSAGQRCSGVSASQMWTCESTIMRRAGCAVAGLHAGDASTRPAPAATVVVRTSRRDNIGGLLLRALSGYAVAVILALLVPRGNNPPQPFISSALIILARGVVGWQFLAGPALSDISRALSH